MGNKPSKQWEKFVKASAGPPKKEMKADGSRSKPAMKAGDKKNRKSKKDMVL